MFSYLDFRCYFKKVVLKLTSISPRDLGESLRRRRRRSAFIYHTFHQSVFYTQSAVRSPQSVFYTDRHKFFHTHNLLQYYKVGDQASVEVEGVEEQMLIFLSSFASLKTIDLRALEFGPD